MEEALTQSLGTRAQGDRAGLPLLVFVSGPPGAGKSTLARALSQRLGLFLVSMDLVKAGIAFTMAVNGRGDSSSVSKMGGPAGRQSFPAGYDIVEVALRHGVSLLLEKAWRRGLDEPRLSRFMPMAVTAQVHVTTTQGIAWEARRSRTQHPGVATPAEIDAKLAAGDLRWEDFGPLDLGVPLYTVDTSGNMPVNLAAVEAMLRTVFATTGKRPGA